MPRRDRGGGPHRHERRHDLSGAELTQTEFSARSATASTSCSTRSSTPSPRRRTGTTRPMPGPDPATPVWGGSGSGRCRWRSSSTPPTAGTPHPTDVDLLFCCLQPTIMSVMMEAPRRPSSCSAGASPSASSPTWRACGRSPGFPAERHPRARRVQHRDEGDPHRPREPEPDLGRSRTTAPGTHRRRRTLQSVSSREYGKPTLWRAIAAERHRGQPSPGPPGTTLLIPPRSGRDRARVGAGGDPVAAPSSSRLTARLSTRSARPLLRGVIDTSVHLPDMFELTFRDPARNVVELGFFLPGTEILLSIDAGEGCRSRSCSAR